MADILSDEDVFGPSASGKAPTGNPFAQPITRVASEEGVMSDADVFGSGGKIKVAKVKTTAPTLREGAEAGLSAGAELGKQYLTAPGATAKRVAKESLSAIDLVTTGPMQMIGDVFGQTVGRVVAAASGATREEANDFGKEYGASIASHPLLNQPLTKLYNWLSNSDEATTVDAAMGKVSETITEIGKKVEKSTGKALQIGRAHV